MSDIEEEIEKLAPLNLDGLRAIWREHFSAPHYGAPPPLRSVELLRLTLAWRLQAEALGGLDQATRRQLKRRGRVRAEGLDLGVGSILRREWQGKAIEVIVEADGFRWDGKVFPSLSAVATAIAGTRWNGPRFFGLREACLRQTGLQPQSGQPGSRLAGVQTQAPLRR